MEDIKKLTKKIIDFRDKRDWKQFHTPKELVISINVEAGELLELFQWKSELEVEEMIKGNKYQKIKDEIADIANYLLVLCNELNINLEDAILDKLKKNEEKYPEYKCKGSNKKYTEL